MYSFLPLKCSVDAEAPIKPKKRADSVPLVVPIGALLKPGSHAWKEGLHQLQNAPATRLISDFKFGS